MDTSTLLLFLGGAGAMTIATAVLIRCTTRLARAIGISPLVRGLTFVAFARGLPELAVGLGAVGAGEADMPLGNVVGSNLFSILGALALCAVIRPVVVASELIRFSVWVMIVVSALPLALGMDGRISRLDGLFLIGLLVGYVIWVAREGRRSVNATPLASRAAMNDATSRAMSRGKIYYVILAVGGVVLLALGSGWMLSCATRVSESLGISLMVVGLFVAAAGTSIPELAATITAAIRNEPDLAVACVVGSSVFNVLGVLGVCALLGAEGIPVSAGPVRFDIPWMIAASFACVTVLLADHRISRLQGVVFMGSYLSYLAYLGLRAPGHEYLGKFRSVVWYVVLLAALTIVLVLIRSVRGAVRQSKTVSRQDA